MASADIEAMYDAAEERIRHLELALARAEHSLSYWVGEAHHGMSAMGDIHLLAVAAQERGEAVSPNEINERWSQWVNAEVDV